MPNQDAPRCMVQGVQVLLLPSGPYIDVAERVRAVHKAGKSFSFERGEVLNIQQRWIYRASITVNGQPFLGDAEIHFGAPAQTPDGTNPITCGQTSAIGNALAFAGFGNLKSVLAQLGRPLESEMEPPLPASRRIIEGIEVVMLNEEPYVDVAERVYWVHRTGKTFSMQQCTLIQYHTAWIYRAAITIENQRYIGDAEIFFDASHEPDRTYPISCGQTSAVGNALAFAGFGDVRSILERLGKEVPDTLQGKPRLASADAVSRALRRVSVMSGTGNMGSGTNPERTPVPITPQQRDRIQALCERLGDDEPDTTTMTAEEADALLIQLERSEEELLLIADGDRQEHPQSVQVPQEPFVSREAVGVLKEAWLQAFRITGTIALKRDQWAQFKRETCQIDVDDMTMLPLHHDQLLAALAAEEERHVSASQMAKTPQASGQIR